jgi:chromosome segregation ATPase
MNIDSNIVIIVGWMLTFIGFIVVWNKAKHEIPSLDMTALRNATEVIENYSKEIKTLRNELDTEKGSLTELKKEYEIDISAMKEKVIELEEKLAERDLVIENLRDWAERLCGQLISVGQVPVGIKVSVEKKKNK